MLEPHRYVKQYDPVIDLLAPTKIVLEEGATDITFTKYPSSSISTSNIQFNNINPPDAETIVDRKIFVKANFRLTFTGTGVAAGDYLLGTNGINVVGQATDAWKGGLSDGQDALRAFPLTQILDSLKVKLNTQTFTQNLNQYIEPVMRYSNGRDVSEEDWSMTPTMQDCYQQYSDFTEYGSARNALGNFGENGYRTPRGGFSQCTVVDQYLTGNPSGTASTGVNDTMIAIVDCSLCEPLFISPLAFGKQLRKGFIGINSMMVTLNIASDYQDYIWSHNEVSSGKTINSIILSYNTTTTGMTERPEIMFTYYTPRFTQEIPRDNLYQYHDINDYILQTSGSLSAGSEQTYTVNNIQLDSVPKRVFIYLKKSEQTKTFNDTDTYARIKAINLTFGNQSGLLSDANENQLYELCVRNGLKSSWSDWTRHTGSVLCLDFSRQISLNEKVIVGKEGSYQIQYRITVQNLSDLPVQYDIHTLVISEGYVNIIGQSLDVSSSLGCIDLELYNSPLIHKIDYEDYDMFFGAGFADKLRKYGKKAWDFTKSAAKKYGPAAANLALSQIPEVGPVLGQIAQQGLEKLASGEITGAQYDKMLKDVQKGAGVMGGMAMGGMAMGGAPAKRSAMRKVVKRG